MLQPMVYIGIYNKSLTYDTLQGAQCEEGRQGVLGRRDGLNEKYQTLQCNGYEHKIIWVAQKIANSVVSVCNCL